MIGCDLLRDLKMYKLPKTLFREFIDDVIMIDTINLPDRSVLEKVEIYLGDRITTDIIKHMPNLKWIHLTCVGFDKLMDLDRDDIIITNSKGVMDDSIISTILAFMFSLSRNLHRCVKNKIDRCEFDTHFNEIQTVIGQKCLIVGMGNIGNKLKAICESMGMGVIGMTRKTNNSLKELVSEADFVVNLLPYTNETREIFDMDVFNSMKKNGFFINVGRGGTVVEKDLIKALTVGVIAGAGLDVFENEPLPEDSELWDIENVILTPHIAGLSQNYWNKEYDLFKENYNRYINLEKMINKVDIGDMND